MQSIRAVSNVRLGGARGGGGVGRLEGSVPPALLLDPTFCNKIAGLTRWQRWGERGGESKGLTTPLPAAQPCSAHQ